MRSKAMRNNERRGNFRQKNSRLQVIWQIDLVLYLEPGLSRAKLVAIFAPYYGEGARYVGFHPTYSITVSILNTPWHKGGRGSPALGLFRSQARWKKITADGGGPSPGQCEAREDGNMRSVLSSLMRAALESCQSAHLQASGRGNISHPLLQPRRRASDQPVNNVEAGADCPVSRAANLGVLTGCC